MTKRTFLPYALVVALFTLAATFGGAAVAAKTIGKNLVVTKSIKNGAVTGPKLAAGAVDGSKLATGAVDGSKLAPGAVDGSKVKDGTLSAADLAPGTIPTVPAPTNGKAAAFGSFPITQFGASQQQVFSPFGPGSSVSTFGAIAPTDLSVADLHVLTANQTGGASIQVSLVTGPDFTSLPNGTAQLLTCLVPNGSHSCSSNQTGTIPAGNVFWLVSTNGASGTSTNFVAAGYTMKVQ